MINKSECFDQALQQVRNRRHIAIEKADALRDELLTTHPILQEIERKLIHLSREKMMARIQQDPQLEKLEQEYTALQLKRSYELTERGYSDNAFSPAFTCKKCEDSGIVDGKFCDCVKRIAHKKMLAQLCEELPSESFTFDNFSLEYYEADDEYQQMKKVFEQCVDYANTFSLSSDSLYMLGNTGLGKTHLTFSMAKEIVSKGFSVIYCSAPNMITLLEKEHFGQAEYPISQYYLNCDLLIIDDLGTEFLSQVAQSSLYNVINHRILMKLPTIINSNLSPKELEQRYGERLVSRIFGCYRALRFAGKDIRIQKRLASKKV